MARVIRKTRRWMQRKQGGKIQEVLIQVQRQRGRWMKSAVQRDGGRQGEKHVRLVENTQINA